MKHYSSLITKIDGEVKERIEQLILDGLIRKNVHPSGELFIYNYSDKCQYDNHWTNETLQCRGLIADKEGNIVARPFAKFFSYAAEEEILEPFVIEDKHDGSLGIMYYHDNDFHIATRGSFDSKQAAKATKMLRKTEFYEKCKNGFYGEFPLKQTYLFEIIYPENRIVVDYGNREELKFLATIDIESGKDILSEDISYAVTLDQLEYLKKESRDNFEGYVIRFKNGIRRKIKLEEYVKLHALITQCSPKRVWEVVKNNDWDDLLQKVPDELHKQMAEYKKYLLDGYLSIDSQAKQDYHDILLKLGTDATRKEIAMEFVKSEYSKILFSKLDNKDYSDYIWKLLEPEAFLTFEQIIIGKKMT